jgi:hypothetical protein
MPRAKLGISKQLLWGQALVIQQLAVHTLGGAALTKTQALGWI